MGTKRVKLVIPFDSLVQSISELSAGDKRRLWRVLDEEMALAEEEAWEKNPAIAAEIAEARSAYQAGDYVTLDEYAARKKHKA